ncbi:MAG: glycosyltransferase family 4 protein [Candidatus Korobacteraceae bacterium]
MPIRVLYVFPGMDAPPKDPAFAEMAHVSGDITIDMLLPLKDKTPENLHRDLGDGSYPTYKVNNLTYHLFLAGRYELGTFRQKFAILWFQLSEGLRLSRRRRFDCVMGYNWGLAGLVAFFLSRLLRAKLIIRLANVPENAYRFNQFGQSWHYSAKVNLKTRLARWVSDVLLRVLVLSSDRLHLLYPDQLKLYPQLQKVPFNILPVFTAVSRIPYTGISDHSILLVGGPWYLKGVDVLIRAFRKIEPEFPNWKLRLLGYFPDEHLLQEMIGDSRRIEILKARPNPEAVKIIADCSVLVLASRSESAGRVLVEGMAAGKPLIGSRVGGVPQYVRDGVNGFLFESENSDDLSEKLRIMLSSPELRASMGQTGRRMAKTQYTAEVWGRKMQEMIELAVNGRTTTITSEQTANVPS